MAENRNPYLLLFVLFLFHCAASSSAPDALPLLRFNTTTDDPCNDGDWVGVSCLDNRVSAFVLEDLSLHSPLPPTSNNISGNIPVSLNSTAPLNLLNCTVEMKPPAQQSNGPGLGKMGRIFWSIELASDAVILLVYLSTYCYDRYERYCQWVHS